MLPSRQNKIRSLGRTWLLRNPKLNPYMLYDIGIYRTITSPFRVLPDFLILGVAKAGTTSLYQYMIQHPDIYPGLRKETAFFYSKSGLKSYRSYFSTIFYKVFIKNIKKQNFLTGEATPGYLFFPYCAEKIFDVIPKAKLIVILRNPVDRAFSHYQQQVSKKLEKLSFEDAIKMEKDRMRDKEGMGNEEYYSNFGNVSYLARGIYVDQLKIWMAKYPKEQFLILVTENLAADIIRTTNDVFKFLNLTSFSPKNLQRQHIGKYKEKMKTETRNQLIQFFKPHNERLFKFLGKTFDWEK